MNKLISVALLICLLASCKKDVKELPPATQTGANTFGAMVDGNMWIPQSFGPFTANNILEARLLGGNLFLKAQNFATSPTETEFDICVIGVTGPGTFNLNTTVNHPSSSYSYAYYVKRNFNPINEWITSATHTGVVTITKLDTTNRIASGTFQFSAGEIYNAAPVLQVTEGRFDVKY